VPVPCAPPALFKTLWKKEGFGWNSSFAGNLDWWAKTKKRKKCELQVFWMNPQRTSTPHL
jgi:hypothetical protein